MRLKTYLWSIAAAAALLLSTTTHGALTVTLAWDPNTETDMSHYVLHQNGVPVVSIPAPGTSATVPLQPGANEFFLVAVNTAGMESDQSNVVAYSALPLATPPTGLVLAVVEPGLLSLTWAANPSEEQITVYRVFASVNGDEFEAIAETPGTSADVLVPTGTRSLLLYVTASNEWGEGKPSAGVGINGPAAPGNLRRQ